MFYKYKALLTVFFILSINTNYIFASPTTSDNNNEKDVLNYVTEIKENIDNTADPCYNFEKYACGGMTSLNKEPLLWNIELVRLVQNLFLDGYDMETLTEKLFIEQTPITRNEEIARDFFLDCKKYMGEKNTSLKVKFILEQVEKLEPFKTFPIEKNVKITGKEIAELEGILHTFGQSLVINLRAYDPETVHVSFGSRSDLYGLSYITDFVHDIQNDKTPNQYNDGDIINIFNFINESQAMVSNLYEEHGFENSAAIESFETIKSKVPLKNFDWSTYEQAFTKALNLKEGEVKFIFRVENEDVLQERINFFDSIDINTIANAQLFLLLNVLTKEFDCRLLSEVNRLTILNRIWKDNLDSKMPQERYNTFLDDFQIKLNSTMSELSEFEDNQVQMLVKNTRSVVDNHSTLISEEILNDYYKDYKDGKFYENFIVYFYKAIGEAFHFITNGKTDDHFLFGMTHIAIELNTKNKPYIYYNNEIGFGLWYNFFGMNDILENTTSIRNCLNEFVSDEVGNYDIKIFVTTYAAVKFIMDNSLTKHQLMNELKISKNLLDSKKLLFISLAQKFCRNDYVSKRDPSIKALTHFKEFNDAFSCSEENKKINPLYNKNCKIETCESYFKNIQHLLPYALSQCPEKN